MSEIDDSTPAEQRPGRTLDLEGLKALSHPLRVKIYDAVSLHGSMTASQLGAMLGESSGATSYHLRQLAKHGFIREDTERGNARDRWWSRVPGSVNLNYYEVADDPAAVEASLLLLRQWHDAREKNLAEFTFRGVQELSQEWVESSGMFTANTKLTREQLAELTEGIDQYIETFLAPYREQGEVPGSRPVQIQFNAFPVIGGVEIPAVSEPVSDETAAVEEEQS